ncbi:MAG: flagellar basal body-associated FliL family protein [bacterium]
MAGESELTELEYPELQRGRRRSIVSDVLQAGILSLFILITVVTVVFLIVQYMVSGTLDGSVTSENRRREPGPPPAVYELGVFRTNLVGFENHFVDLDVSLAYPVDGGRSRKLLEEEIRKREAQIRDIITLSLSAKSYEDLVTREGKIRFEEEMVGYSDGRGRKLGRLNEIFGSNQRIITDLYFKRFVVY